MHLGRQIRRKHRKQSFCVQSPLSICSFILLLFVCIVLFQFLTQLLNNSTQTQTFDFTEPEQDKYSILLNTYRRNDLLKVTATSLSSCNKIKDIFVIWSDLQNSPPDFLERIPKVALAQFEEDSLNNRFYPLEEIMTDAVIAMDDDIGVSCENLDGLYDAWRSHENLLIGLSRRLWKRGRYVWKKDMIIRDGYNILLTKIAMFHRKYLNIYWSEQYSWLRTYVDDRTNCEDFAMNFLIRKEAGMSGIWYSEPFEDNGVKKSVGGLHTRKDHKSVRQQCLSDFERKFGVPLETKRWSISSLKADKEDRVINSNQGTPGAKYAEDFGMRKNIFGKNIREQVPRENVVNSARAREMVRSPGSGIIPKKKFDLPKNPSGFKSFQQDSLIEKMKSS